MSSKKDKSSRFRFLPSWLGGTKKDKKQQDDLSGSAVNHTPRREGDVDSAYNSVSSSHVPPTHPQDLYEDSEEFASRGYVSRRSGAIKHDAGVPDPQWQEPRFTEDERNVEEHLPYNERGVDVEEPRPATSIKSDAQTRIASASSSLSRQKSIVYYGLDRKKADWLLLKAIKFVEEEGDITLQRAYDVRNSPLLVFLKNDSKLQEDIDNAKRCNRGGNDVMLVVVTDRTDLRLVDTKATKHFGQKVCLYWNQGKGKFRCSENYDSMVWIRDFLEPFQIDMTVKFTRMQSLRRSLRETTSGKAKGSYHVLTSNMEEEVVRNAVLYFDQQLVELQKALHAHPWPKPLILFCRGGNQETLERMVAEFMHDFSFAKLDLHVVVFCRSNQIKVYGQGRDFPTFLRLRIHDLRPMLDERAQAENKMVASTIKKYLQKNAAADRRRNSYARPHQESRAHVTSGVMPYYEASTRGAACEDSGNDGDHRSVSQSIAISHSDTFTSSSLQRRQPGAGDQPQREEARSVLSNQRVVNPSSCPHERYYARLPYGGTSHSQTYDGGNANSFPHRHEDQQLGYGDSWDGASGQRQPRTQYRNENRDTSMEMSEGNSRRYRNNVGSRREDRDMDVEDSSYRDPRSDSSYRDPRSDPSYLDPRRDPSYHDPRSDPFARRGNGAHEFWSAGQQGSHDDLQAEVTSKAQTEMDVSEQSGSTRRRRPRQRAPIPQDGAADQRTAEKRKCDVNSLIDGMSGLTVKCRRTELEPPPTRLVPKTPRRKPRPKRQ